MQIKKMDEMIECGKSKITSSMKATFFSVIIFGLIAHLYMFTNKFPNYDDFAGINTYGVTIRLGRWFLWITGAVMQNMEVLFSMPWLNGIMTLLLAGLCAVMVVELFHMNSFLDCILIGALWIVFPTWTISAFSMFVLFLYTISLFLSILAVWLVRSDVKWCGVSILLIALSMGIYQSYITVTATLFVILLMIETFKKNVNFKYLLKKSCIYLGILLGGGIVYFLFTKFFCWFKGIELSSYKGMDSIGNIGISKIFTGLKDTFYNVVSLIFNNDMEMSYNLILKVVFAVLFVLGLAMYLYWFFLLLKKNKAVAILYLLYLPAMLIAINGMYFGVADREDVYLLMSYAYVFLLILPIVLFRHILDYVKEHQQVWYVAQWIMVFGLAGAIYSYIAYANGQYLSMELSWSQAKGYYTVMVDEIKSTEGYTDEMSVMIVGDEIEDKHFYDNSIMGVFDVKGRSATYLNIWSRKDALKYYFGFAPEYIECTAENYSEDIRNMPCYPDEGSIKNVDGVIVVKFEDIEKE